MTGDAGGRPKRSAVRIVCAAAAAAASAFEGTSPVHAAVPPARSRSTMATRKPSAAATRPAASPPEPMPTMTRS